VNEKMKEPPQETDPRARNVDVQLVPAERKRGTHAYVVLAFGDPVGELEVCASLGKDRCARVVWAGRTSLAHPGAFTAAYHALFPTLELTVLSSDLKMSKHAQRFWSRLRPAAGFQVLRLGYPYRHPVLPGDADPEISDDPLFGKVRIERVRDLWCLVTSRPAAERYALGSGRILYDENDEQDVYEFGMHVKRG
jgi:hypothetical protein